MNPQTNKVSVALRSLATSIRQVEKHGALSDMTLASILVLQKQRLEEMRDDEVKVYGMEVSWSISEIPAALSILSLANRILHEVLDLIEGHLALREIQAMNMKEL